MKSSKGFSLLEIMVVIALAGILSAIAISSMATPRKNAKLRDAISMIQADFEKARSRAIRENAFVVVIINTNTNTNAYRIFIDNGAGGGTAGNWTRDSNETVLCDASLPAGITISQTTFTNNRTRYDGRGYITNNGKLTLYLNGNPVKLNNMDAEVKMTNRFGRITTPLSDVQAAG